ncbi:hypothetical protein FZC28_6796g3399 [Saccharomyces cerevisiae]|nr:hypothetical protein FZC28_6796g3399 [Saccharomyces cerevisiae]KAJ1053029.1 hypothetical protein FZC27_7776g2298 [Saccharomyces cerevisiae]
MPESRLQRLANLKIGTPQQLRRTSIIGTIGPKTNSCEAITALRKAGLNIIRLNFSHGSYEFHQSVIENAVKSEQQFPGRPLAIALDTKGPEIRTGRTLNDQDLYIPVDHQMIFTTDASFANTSNDKIMYIDYANLTKVIVPGRFIYVDDGILSFKVLQIIDESNLRVQADLQFGVRNGIHIVFASFIRTSEDVLSIRKALGSEGQDIKIISKIENQQGLDNFDEILEVTDGVMIARGDLGIEILAPEVLAIQKKLIAKCNLAGKPVICATQMLDSMTHNPRPTRAEVSDVGNAVLDGADCVMLSGETAKGDYPVNAVNIMAATALIAESTIAHLALYDDLRDATPKPTSTTETVAAAATAAILEQDGKAIVVLSTTGNTARLLSKYRPSCPIILVTRHARTARIAHLYRGVFPFLYEPKRLDDWGEDVHRRLKFGVEMARSFGMVDNGDTVVSIQGFKGGIGHSNTLRISTVGQEF